jgi:hypothetical protein
MKLSIRQVAERENTSIRSVYRWISDGLTFYDLIGGIKIEEADLESYLGGKKKCLSGRTNRVDTTLPSSEGEAAFIESARLRRRGGTRSERKQNSSPVSVLSAPERS